ncbi:hypothetical protein [Roseovarius sp. E0-M6]|uniref:hypothetical protein n=1 Tax=Roseovarius sp. E0-M6 TaxID=3127118 RepID=UPI0030101031
MRKAGLASGQLFSPGGGTGRSFRLTGAESEVTLSLFPVDLAEHLLARADELEALDRFRIAAYIRAYFGSPARIMGRDDTDDHEALGLIAEAAGYDASIFQDRAALDAELVEAGWRPTHDMLDRLGIADPWLRDHMQARVAAGQTPPAGFAVYFLRKRAMSPGRVEMARTAIHTSGFEILAEQSLSPDLVENLRKSTRGGNWRKGPFPVSGGPPAYLFFVLDVFPHPPYAKTRLRHPLLDNFRTLTCKERIRTAILTEVASSQAFNPVHSTDTSNEAAKIASMVLGAAACLELLRSVDDRLAQVAQRADGGTPAGPATNGFVYMRRGSVLRKLYRPHLASKAGAALALHRGLGVSDPGWGRMLDGSSEAGYVDFAEPGEGLRPVAVCPLPLDLRALEQLRDILKDTETAGWRIDENSLFESLWYSPERSKLVILGAEGERGEGGLLGGMPAKRWREVFGVPRSVSIQGNPLRRWLWRHMIHPAASWIGRVQRSSRQGLSGLRRLLRR